MIIITHFGWSDERRLQLLFPFWIEMAVPIFMIISGYVYSLSYDTHHMNELHSLYSLPDMWRRLMRYTVPFFIAYLIEMISYVIIGSEPGVLGAISIFIDGGVGPGSYYYPMMYQFIVVFPLIFLIVKKFKKKGVAICFIFNFMFELLKTAYGMGDETYRLILLRYVFLIAFGCYFFLCGRTERPNIKFAVIMI